MSSPIPVTILSGFLGAGKTTLLRHLLKAEHGLKIAVIENEFSDAGIDTQLLGDEPVQVMTLSNGCVCCTIHTDLTKALYLLLERLDSGEIAFDRLVIECTGLADPAPVAQTFFIDEELRERYLLDGRLEISNTRAENSIRPFVMGRKNWLFSNTPNGAKASAVYYSLIVSAKENGLVPFEYLTKVFTEPPNGAGVESLMPWCA